MPISVKADDRDVSVLRRRPSCFNIEINPAAPAGVEESPMLAAGKSGGEPVELSFVQMGLRQRKVTIIPCLSASREALDLGFCQKVLPLNDAVLPESPFCGGPDSLKEEECGGHHCVVIVALISHRRQVTVRASSLRRPVLRSGAGVYIVP